MFIIYIYCIYINIHINIYIYYIVLICIYVKTSPVYRKNVKYLSQRIHPRLTQIITEATTALLAPRSSPACHGLQTLGSICRLTRANIQKMEYQTWPALQIGHDHKLF